jgi:2,5-diketo-D-gluconate reductase B
MKLIRLSSGQEMPALGLGTYRLHGAECVRSIEHALEVGYRLIDTAQAYGNQEFVGEGIKKIERESLFLTSKLWITDLSSKRVAPAIECMLKELDVDYLDMLLIHWPGSKKEIRDSLEKVVEAKERGLIKVVGVSNFVLHHLTKEVLEEYSIEVNQLEYHPFLQQLSVVEKCKKSNIHVQAYSSLARGKVCEDICLQEIAEKYNKKPEQVALKWAIQKGMSVLPKTKCPERMQTNFESLEIRLTDEEVDAIDLLERNERLVKPAHSNFHDFSIK